MNEFERLDALYQRDQGIGVPYPETGGGGMTMERYELEAVIGRMVNLMGAEEVLMELARAMSTDELEDNLDFISRMNDLGVMGE